MIKNINAIAHNTVNVFLTENIFYTFSNNRKLSKTYIITSLHVYVQIQSATLSTLRELETISN